MGSLLLRRRGSSQPRDQASISCIAGGFFTIEPPAAAAAAAAKSLQSCQTLCDPIYCSPPGSPVPGILQPRTLEWVAISFPNAWKWKVKVKSLSHVWLLASPWTAAYQAAPSMGFSRQEYWSGVPLPSPTEPPGKLQIPGFNQLKIFGERNSRKFHGIYVVLHLFTLHLHCIRYNK